MYLFYHAVHDVIELCLNHLQGLSFALKSYKFSLNADCLVETSYGFAEFFNVFLLHIVL
jgi:hypothetical protein